MIKAVLFTIESRKDNGIFSNRRSAYEECDHQRCRESRRRKAVLFDLGGTLHTASSPPGRDAWFARRLLDRLSDYGVELDVSPEELAS